MKKLLKKITCNELLAEASERFKEAFAANNMTLKYNLLREGEDLKKIAKILNKYEEMFNHGDFY